MGGLVSIDRGVFGQLSQNTDNFVDMLVDNISKYGVTVKDMLEADKNVLSASDMKYFSPEYYGKLPSYGLFCRCMKRDYEDQYYEICELEAEIMRRGVYDKMDEIANKDADEWDGTESKRFGMFDKLHKANERVLDRIDKKRDNKGVEQGVDLAVKIISALKNSELVKVVEDMNAIDAEFSIKEGSDNGK